MDERRGKRHRRANRIDNGKHEYREGSCIDSFHSSDSEIQLMAVCVVGWKPSFIYTIDS